MAVLGNILILIAAVIGFYSVAMMFYTLSKAMEAPTVAENRAWKKRYYCHMALFIALWLVGFIGFGMR